MYIEITWLHGIGFMLGVLFVRLLFWEKKK